MFFLTAFYSLLILSSIMFYGFIFNKIFNFKVSNYTHYFILGSLAIIFFSLAINFFLPLNIFITSTIFYFTSILGLIFITFKLKKFKELTFIIIFTTLITYKSSPYDDYYLYQLPYIEILKKFIEFGDFEKKVLTLGQCIRRSGNDINISPLLLHKPVGPQDRNHAQQIGGSAAAAR